MKALISWLFFFIAFAAYAQESAPLKLSGTVPLKAEVNIHFGKAGQAHIQSKSSPGLKTEIEKRRPASIVRVSAP
ncbi:MAG: hypothetical protein OM95_08155 [Bdellovibrio sp. ArHS]|uniref:hypothetical protein n=1 Tax=Bdellovibrio sp. ArHS TaxID=1569284 RepID=UPI0005835832|nr:hypothetical protein [Bdellovibrio sp. ArHS]KHD88477.1 MAG: hypothetical protein OM95_08155 [Bdellovibrio sp. ArHS]